MSPEEGDLPDVFDVSLVVPDSSIVTRTLRRALPDFVGYPVVRQPETIQRIRHPLLDRATLALYLGSRGRRRVPGDFLGLVLAQAQATRLRRETSLDVFGLHLLALLLCHPSPTHDANGLVQPLLDLSPSPLAAWVLVSPRLAATLALVR